VSDGDTVRLRFLDGRRERTRLIGLDAPEEHPGEKLERDVVRTGRDRETILALGRQASAFTRRLGFGAAAVLEKPFAPAQLVTAVRGAVAHPPDGGRSE
jgi:micrococcal nuclease